MSYNPPGTAYQGGDPYNSRPAVGPRAKVTYTIKTTTGDLPGAGTSAGVFIQLHGSKAESKRVALKNHGEVNFERGQKDVFVLKELDLGEIESVTVSHDNSSTFNARFDADWFLDQVTVRDSNSEWVFPCRRWLSKTKEDRQTRRTLYSRAAEANIAYKVTTFTADRPGAGTLGNVLIQLHGQRGTAGPFVELRNTSLHDVFEQSQKDMFIIRGRDVGPIREIAVRHATQEGRPWGLAGVIVRNQKTHEEIVFPCREEVDANAVVNLRAQPGAVISIAPGRAKAAAEARAKTAALEPASKVLFLDHADKSRCHNPYKGMAALQPHPLSFDVSVLTSDVKGAGTDANVFIRIFGTIRTSPSIRLAAHALCTTRLFLRGQNDKFRVFLPDVGFITKISLWTDCRNLSDQGGTWHCGKVTINKTVNSDGGQQAYIFPCNREFDGSAGESGGAGNKIDLAPAGVSGVGLQRPQTAAPSRLVSRAGGSRPATRAGDEATIQYDGGRGGGGGLDMMVRGRPASAGARPTVGYGGGMERGTLDRSGMALPAGLQQRAALRIFVRTGDRPRAGTDCEVMIRIKGSKKSSGTHKLSACAVTSMRLFLRGATNEFVIQDWEIGDPLKVSIWHDGKGVDAHWFLEDVTIVDASNRRFHAKHQAWLSAEEGRRQLRAELDVVPL